MARMSRAVVPGLPHHVTQRGVRSMQVFGKDADYELYLRFMREQGDRFGVRFLAWCLMRTHVHLITVPRKKDSLASGIGEAHRRYTRAKNIDQGVRGYLFQGRFSSCVLDEPHLLAAVCYTELNPCAARVVKDPGTYRWSSAGFHLGRRKRDSLVEDRSLLGLVTDWRKFLAGGMAAAERDELEHHLSTGRPLGSDQFVKRLESRLRRPLAPRKGGWPKGKPRKRSN